MSATVIPLPVRHEGFLTKRQLAQRLGVSVRWLEYRVAEGMPCRRFGRAANAPLRFKLSEVESWLGERGAA